MVAPFPMATKKSKSALQSIEDLAITIAIVGGAASWLERTYPPADPEQSFAKLLWLVVPAIFAGLFISRGKWWPQVGLAPRFGTAGPWYLLALLGGPLISGALLLLSDLFGAAKFSPLSVSAQWTLSGHLLLPLLIKNLFEEFCWRGYFTPRFQETKMAGLPGHLVTGLIWAMWHLPYWLVFLPPIEVSFYGGLPVLPFIALAFVMLPLQSVFYGELRLVSGSVWPAYIFHVVANVLTFGMLRNAFIKIDGPLAILITPGSQGVLYSVALFAIGMAMMKYRKAAEKAASAKSIKTKKSKKKAKSGSKSKSTSSSKEDSSKEI